MSEQMVELSHPPADLLALSKAEIDLQIATAKTYPRSLKEFPGRRARDGVLLARGRGEDVLQASAENERGQDQNH